MQSLSLTIIGNQLYRRTLIVLWSSEFMDEAGTFSWDTVDPIVHESMIKRPFLKRRSDSLALGILVQYLKCTLYAFNADKKTTRFNWTLQKTKFADRQHEGLSSQRTMKFEP